MQTWKRVPKDYVESNYTKTKIGYTYKTNESTSTRGYYNQSIDSGYQTFRTKTPSNKERTVRKAPLTERGEKRRFDFLNVRTEETRKEQRTPSRKTSFKVNGVEYSPNRHEPVNRNLGLNERLKKMGINVGGIGERESVNKLENVETIVIEKRYSSKRGHSKEVKQRSGSLKSQYNANGGGFYYGKDGVIFTPLKGKTTTRITDTGNRDRSEVFKGKNFIFREINFIFLHFYLILVKKIIYFFKI